jgi:hypothetical protein
LTRRSLLAALAAHNTSLAAKSVRTTVAIVGDRFLINGAPTYAGRSWNGKSIEGLLLNSRMVQGVFDDENPATRSRWKYVDTGAWDPERNTREFLAAMPEWRQAGLLAITINFQGGSPEGYSKDQPWINSAFRPDGSLKPAYAARMKRVLDRADELGMVVIVGYFYFGQDERLRDENAIKAATSNATRWIRERGYRHVLIEIANDCDNSKYDHPILRPERITELMRLVKSIEPRLYVSASFNGGRIPAPNVVAASDFILMHGNGVKDPARISAMVREARALPTYRTMPIVFNEDDHFEFDKAANNMSAAIAEHASWGYFDPEGYQSPPINWRINTERKKAFFDFVRRVTGS